MEKIKQKTKPESSVVPREAVRRDGDETSTGRRILMFPLTRLIVAIALFLGLQQLLITGAATLLGNTQQMSSTLTALIQAFAAVAVFRFIGKVIEHRPLAANGLASRGMSGGIVEGFILGAVVISAVMGILALAGWYVVDGTSLQQPEAWSGVLGALVLFLAVAVFEEVAFRGLLFRIIEEGLGSWLALVITAGFFGLIHLANANATFLGTVGVVLGGVLFGAAYMLTRSLWLAIGIHWSWNFFLAAVFGAPSSGRSLENSLVDSTIGGPELWIGGSFGPEAGLVLHIAVVFVSAIILTLVVKRGNIVTPRWMRWRSNKKTAGV